MESTTYRLSEDIRAFLQEKKYLENISTRTIVLYESCFRAFAGALEPHELQGRVVELRSRGVSPITVNTYLRHIKCYYGWKGLEWKIPKLKEEQKALSVLSPTQMKSLLSFRPVGVNLKRAHLVCLTILDTGLRASEVLGLTTENIDLDNLVFRVHGKGGKHRLVPFSTELCKSIFRHLKSIPKSYIFGTKNNTKVSVRNLERDFKVLGDKIGINGIRFSPHTFRHTFAVSYLRNGGNLEYLRRILGHSSLTVTQGYLKALGVEELCQVHSHLSPLTMRQND